MNHNNTNFQRAQERGSEVKYLFYRKVPIIHIEGVIKLENHHLAANILGIQN